MTQPSPTVPYDTDAVYVLFETNEGDTPRILSSLFTSAWLSADRGTVPVAWAVDPLLGELFPELWNVYASTATANDTFLAGVDGAGYVFVNVLGEHEEAYEQRAVSLMNKLGLSAVDVGVASDNWPATSGEAIGRYAERADALLNSSRALMFMNACGAQWGQPLLGSTSSGSPIVSSVCVGPANDTTFGHYLYYYRSGLNATDPAVDLAGRLKWAKQRYKRSNEPLFLLAFGGLGLYGGNSDFFKFIQQVLEAAGDTNMHVVGVPDFQHLAGQALGK